MKKIFIIWAILIAANSIFAEENTNVENEKKVNEVTKKTNTKKIEFWDFYEQQQTKFLKPNDQKLFNDLDKSVRPQDDFYKYVNNKWDKSTVIPRAKSSWGSFVEVTEKNHDFLKNLIKELEEKNVSGNTNEQKILTLYKSFSDMKKRNELGISPIKNSLDKINAIKDIKDLQKYNIENTRQGENEFYGWGIGTDFNNAKNYAVFLGSASLGLSVDYYQKDTAENRKILAEYTNYVSDILKFAGEKDTLQKAQKIVQFEKDMANTMLKVEDYHDVKKYNNPKSVKDLANITKNINLADYLQKVGVNTDKVIITELNYFKNLDRFLRDENIDLIKDYMKFQLVDGSSSYLTDQLGKRSFEFYGKYLNGQKERETLEKRALYFTNGSLGEMVGQIYVKRNFSPEAKRDTKEMVEYIRKALKNRITKLTWMSETTKKKALEKLAKINVKIGYPDKWKDYSTLVFTNDDTLYDLVEKMNDWSYKEALKKVGKPVDKTEWGMSANTVNAYYSPTGNEIVFPAGILQPPFYDVKNSEAAANFGAIGTVIAHEITHGFDVSGASYDGDGNVRNWWTAEDKAKFDAVSKKLANEFSSYTVIDDTKVNGEFTLTENIADLGGVNIAYDALQLYLKDHPDATKAYDDTISKLFFLSYARMWRQKSTPEYLKNMTKSDSHSPNFLRVNAILKNVDAFEKTFEVKEGDKMYKAPADRIKIW